jgi:hypothetical protein
LEGRDFCFEFLDSSHGQVCFHSFCPVFNKAVKNNVEKSRVTLVTKRHAAVFPLCTESGASMKNWLKFPGVQGGFARGRDEGPSWHGPKWELKLYLPRRAVRSGGINVF